MQFWPPDDEHMCSKHVEAWNKLIVKRILCIKLVKYWDKNLHTLAEFWPSKEVQSSLFYPYNPSIRYMHRQVYIKISKFHPHSVFMCVAGFSQLKTINFLRRIHWFLFLIEIQCVLCDVRIDILCKMWINFSPKMVKCTVGWMVFAVNNATLHRTDQYRSVCRS